MAFSEERLDVVLNGIVMSGVTGGPKFSTTVVTVNGGYEQRNKNWLSARGYWQLGNRLFKDSEAALIIDFFRARGGKYQGFRFKDWSDYKDMGRGILGTGLSVANQNQYQMFKRYQSGVDKYDRKIAKPISSTVKVFADGVQIASGSGFGQATVDSTTGIVTLGKKSATITNITKYVQAVVTSNNTFQIGDVVHFDSVVGMTQINGMSGTVVAAGSSSFTVDINSSSFSTYSSGGNAVKYPLTAGKVLTWTGEFDIPVRFDTDDLTCQIDDVTRDMQGNITGVFHNIGNLPIVEIRV